VIIISVYVFMSIYFVVYLYISGMGRNLRFQELFGFTPCLTFVHAEYRAFVLSPLQTWHLYHIENLHLPEHPMTAACSIRQQNECILCHKYMFKFFASLFLLTTSHWHWWVFILCISIPKSETVLHCIYLYVQYIRYFKYKFYHN
jgi:hypothetical protein